MKNLLYLGIILMLASCGSNECDSLSSEMDKQIRTNTFTSEEVLPDAQEFYFKCASNLGKSNKLTKESEEELNKAMKKLEDGTKNLEKLIKKFEETDCGK